MPILIEHITEIVFVLFVFALMGNLFLIGIVFTRRQRRQKFFERLDSLRDRYGPTLSGILAGKVEYQHGLDDLREMAGSDRTIMLERLCLEQKPAPQGESVLKRLCEDLGLVKIWQQRLMGQIDPSSLRESLRDPQKWALRVKSLQFLVRAKSAENLGRIRHEPSWHLLVKLLEDPHPDLQSVAARALGAIHHPASFPFLVEQLHKVIADTSPALSVRAIKSALVSFPLAAASALLPSLRHPNSRLRFIATDIVRGMVEREAGGDPEFCLNLESIDSEVYEIFLEQLSSDESADVRARAVPVVARLSDPRSVRILLTLLGDATWFVRLHTVRSLARPKFLPQVRQVAVALTDSNWRVREAAVRTLRSFGATGTEQLVEHFLETRDRYSREQIADEFQRAGMIPELVTGWVRNGNGNEGLVLAHLAEMGKTSYLLSVVSQSNGDGHLQKMFLQRFGKVPDPQIQEWVQVTQEQPREA